MGGCLAIRNVGRSENFSVRFGTAARPYNPKNSMALSIRCIRANRARIRRAKPGSHWALVRHYRNFAKSRASMSAAGTALIFALFFGGSILPILGQPATTLSNSNSNLNLKDEFAIALRAVEDRRKNDRSTLIECTPYFTRFYSYQQTEPYVASSKVSTFHQSGMTTGKVTSCISRSSTECFGR